jgi:Spy/CpxP family protein refolding chaperone
MRDRLGPRGQKQFLALVPETLAAATASHPFVKNYVIVRSLRRLAVLFALCLVQISYAQTSGATDMYSITAGPWISPSTGGSVGKTGTTWRSDGAVLTVPGGARVSPRQNQGESHATSREDGTEPTTAGAERLVGMAIPAGTQDNGSKPSSGRPQFQHIHGPRSIDQELAHLTHELQLTREQQQQIRPLLEKHHDEVQSLLDKNPNATREQLASQIHALSDETHHQIHALLSDRQKVLEEALLHRGHYAGETRPFAAPRPPSP